MYMIGGRVGMMYWVLCGGCHKGVYMGLGVVGQRQVEGRGRGCGRG